MKVSILGSGDITKIHRYTKLSEEDLKGNLKYITKVSQLKRLLK